MSTNEQEPPNKETPAEQPAHGRGRIGPYPYSEDDLLRKVIEGGPSPEKKSRPTPPPAPPKHGKVTTPHKPTKGAK